MKSENIEYNNIKQPFSPFETMKQNNPNSDSKIDKFKNFIYTKKIYFIGIFILLLIIIIIIIATSGNKDSESSSNKEPKEEEINESKYYSQKTKN